MSHDHDPAMTGGKLITTQKQANSTIAAIDLGSNSFHMVVAEDRNGQLFIIDRIRDMVRLAAGLDAKGNLAAEVEQRALDCLQRFGQRLRELDSKSVSAVGTNTLRRTKNSDLFLQHAEDILGHPIEIISGIEEARLIYQGVAHSIEPDEKDKLVMDIGGGSTELIIGKEFQPRMMESLEMGCVTMTRRFFSDGKITNKRVNKARIHVLQKMKPFRHVFRNEGWDVVIGASGTIKSAGSVIKALGLSDQGDIDFESLQKLIQQLKEFEKIENISLAGLSERRIPVFLGGVIVLAGVCEALDIDEMHVSDGALREGLLYDMLGRRHNKDIRNQSIDKLAMRFHVDEQHAQRIEKTVCDFLAQVQDNWMLDAVESQKLLTWAAKTHEIGRDISHAGYHKHSAYIVENTDLAGFSQQEKRRLAALVKTHRGKLSSKQFDTLTQRRQSPVVKMAVLLRLAVILHRSRVPTSLPNIGLQAQEQSLTLTIPPEWLEQHPLTLNDLEQEADYLQGINFELVINN